MADSLQRLIAHANAGLRGEASPEWTAEAGRAAIRRSLAAAFPQAGGIEDLAHRPKVPDWWVSISHTLDYGGWVAAKIPVGLDFEQKKRIKPAVLARICHPGERENAPDPTWLWGAKEACFKALTSQPATITEVLVQGWRRDGAFWRFEAQGGYGWVDEDGGRLTTLFLI